MAAPDKLPGLSEQERDILQKVFSSPLDIPAAWKAWLVAYLEANPPEIPFTQLFGYQNFVSTQVSMQADSGQSLSGTFASGTNASAAGPGIALAPAGKYIIFAGAEMATQFGNGVAQMTVSPGGMVVRGSAASAASVAKASLVTLAVDTAITSTLFVAGDGSATNVTSTITGAWLIAVRYDNP